MTVKHGLRNEDLFLFTGNHKLHCYKIWYSGTNFNANLMAEIRSRRKIYSRPHVALRTLVDMKQSEKLPFKLESQNHVTR